MKYLLIALILTTPGCTSTPPIWQQEYLPNVPDLYDTPQTSAGDVNWGISNVRYK